MVSKTIEKVAPAQTEKWNTRNLGLRVAADGASALSAGLLVAPVITMIDKAIIVRAATSTPLTHTLASSLRMLLFRPHAFLLSTPFFLVSSLYTGTYLTANLIDTLSSTLSSATASTTTSGPAKFLATSAANLSLCLYKDSQFTRMFGAGSTSPTSTPPPPASHTPAPRRAIPRTSYALFALRDSLTIFASFNLPPLLAPHFSSSPLLASLNLSPETAAQFLAPASMQLLSTPLHLLGLDLYNRPRGQYMHWTGRALVGYGPSPWERARKVARDWVGSSVARMGRIVPAFGVGGVVNGGLRGRLMRGLE
ncbi:hypothetical protein EV356DRAFT_536226 [Viridothelium virens]|uniref:Sequence orphan n=1 Tax=Viridothelium virens TaxID=1048519 RepID=A0A6A6GXZ8_VIRVR|nr:hypothetical protein EV356DRAFT_536226 [Viridothelium virens]